MTTSSPAEVPASEAGSEAARMKSAEVLGRLLYEGKDLYEAAGFKEENLDALYQAAHAFYTAGNYADAETLFSCLCLFNTRNKRNWMALGGAAMARKNYTTASEAYTFAQILDLEDPEPVVRTYECHLASGDLERAADSIQTLIGMTADRPEWAELHGQSLLLLNELKNPAVE